MQQEVRTLTSTDIKVTTTDKQDSLGALGTTGDNRLFRYAQVGAAQVAAGLCVNSPAGYISTTTTVPVTSAVTASPNSMSVSVTLGATAITQNQFAEGFLSVVSGSGAGAAYKVKGNTVGLPNGSATFYLNEPIAIALDTTSKVSLQVNPWSACVIGIGTGSTNDNPKVAGVTVVTVPANNYCWIQTNGYGVVTSDQQATVYAGLCLVLSNTGTPVAGCVQTAAGNADADKQAIGVAYANVSTTGVKLIPAYLTIG